MCNLHLTFPKPPQDHKFHPPYTSSQSPCPGSVPSPVWHSQSYRHLLLLHGLGDPTQSRDRAYPHHHCGSSLVYPSLTQALTLHLYTQHNTTRIIVTHMPTVFTNLDAFHTYCPCCFLLQQINAMRLSPLHVAKALCKWTALTQGLVRSFNSGC